MRLCRPLNPQPNQQNTLCASRPPTCPHTPRPAAELVVRVPRQPLTPQPTNKALYVPDSRPRPPRLHTPRPPAELVVRVPRQPAGARGARARAGDHQPGLLPGRPLAAVAQHGCHAQAVGPAQVGLGCDADGLLCTRRGLLLPPSSKRDTLRMPKLALLQVLALQWTFDL